MTIDTVLLRSFLEIAERNSFTRAAAHLNISQPTLSARIRKLESQYGFPLFQRTTRNLDLSPEGRQLLPQVTRIIKEADQLGTLVCQLRGTAANRLNFGTCTYNPSFRWQIVDGFMRRHPDMSVQVDMVDLPPDQLRRLREGSLDIGLLWGAFDHNEFQSMLAFSNELGFIMPPDSLLAAGKKISTKKLAGQTVSISRREIYPEVYDALTPYLTAAGAKYVICPESEYQGMLTVVRRSGVPALLCLPIHHGREAITKSIESEGLVYRSLADFPMTVDFHLVRARTIPSRAVKLFWDELPGYLQTPPAYENAVA